VFATVNQREILYNFDQFVSHASQGSKNKV
jgi:hypothetical protein